MTAIPQLCFVSCYTDIHQLAHAPDGTSARQSQGVLSFMLDAEKGLLTSVGAADAGLNPSFLALHPSLDVLYSCTESVVKDGEVWVLGFERLTGRISALAPAASAQGTSTCYLFPSRNERHLLYCNYWSSSVGSLELEDTGAFAACQAPAVEVPSQFRGIAAKPHGTDPHSEHRLRETHAHAIQLDPAHGRLAFVPDLGEDVIKRFIFNPKIGSLEFAGTENVDSMFDRSEVARVGPRYLVFHPKLDVVYVVNELASTVSVHTFSRQVASMVTPENTGIKTLRQLQSVSTIPAGFPRKLNTCSGLMLDPSGELLGVANRGHDSIALYRVNHAAGAVGQLSLLQINHTGGREPRHFAWDATGQFLLACNQNSDELALMRVDRNSGAAVVVQTVRAPSCNFVLPCPPSA
eukprot:TRINITY_DN7610_c0_g1_i2.p1 TRINITY_DN7610_c0_g1~~TRINITY_DN7610_c0_g1_i2.p1  ORF type:complete len:407 (+),score=61.84 TRINITY_DN7610_c0_g1_i2:60-1280(+)